MSAIYFPADDCGITGVLADVFGLPADAAPAAGDVAMDVLSAGRWTPLAPAAVTLEQGAGVGGSDRIAIDLPGRSARNTWLRVTLNATATSGLAAQDVFYFASLPGETGDGGWSTVTAADLTRARAALGSADAAALSRYDFNHDGVVNARDLATARANQGHAVPPLPTEPPPPAAAAAAARRRTANEPARRGVWDLLQADGII